MRILTRTWQPLLDGAAAKPARAAIDAIAQALREPLPAFLAPGLPAGVRATADVSLTGGAAGIALFYSYLAEATGDDAHAKLALAHLGRAMEGVANLRMGSSLYGGFPGIAWAVQHLHDRHELSGEDPLEEIDAALHAHLSTPRPRPEYDLTSGLVGLGVYALERLPRSSAAELLRLVVDRLSESAEKVTPGTAWPNPPEVPGHEKQLDGRYNLGLAHGLPGVIAFLAQAWLVEPALRSRAEGLVSRAVAFLLSSQLSHEGSRRFPYSTGAGAQPTPARSAWCYGDPGVAAALLRAGRCLGEPSWERAAIELARGVATLSVPEAKVTDAGLCHGATGLGHIFNRLWQETGDEGLQHAASRWLATALGMRREGQGLAGFQMDYGGGPDGPLRVDDPGFLTGSAGIGLALLSATTPVEPDWDRLLLLSGPKSGR